MTDQAGDAVMNAANGHSRSDHAPVSGAWPVVLLRYRAGIVGEASRVVHLVPLPPEGQARGAGVALCGALLCSDQVETVTAGHGMPCDFCMISHLAADPSLALACTPATVPLADHHCSQTDPLVAAVGYRAWGWPVTSQGNYVWLSLDPDTVALIIPVPLATQVIKILNQRRCRPSALVHPDRPDHWVLLAGQRYGVALPWPPSVHRLTSTLPLPPSMTATGRVSWVHPPEADALRLCREFDVFAALRTALREPSPGEDPPSGGDAPA